MSEEKTDWRSMLDKEYIGHWDLPRDVTLMIARVVGGEVFNPANNEKKKKPILYFEKTEKGMVGNATNCKIIAAMYATNIVQEWVGKRITLFATTCQGKGGETVDCIRVRPMIPAERKAS